MTLWLIFSLMTAAAIFAVLWPLARRGGATRSGSELAVYRDQLAEIDRDLAAGLIGAPEAEAARLEVSRRLLAAADRPDQDAAAAGAAPLWRRRAVALVAFILLPLGSAALYITLGSPNVPGMPLASRTSQPAEGRSLGSMVSEVEAHLARNPDDARGWQVLAPVYMRAGRFDDAVRVRRNLLRLMGSDAEREGDLGEAMVAAANGIVTAEAKAVFGRALAHDAKDLRARYYTGLAAEQDGKPEEATRIWRALLDETPQDAPYRPLIQGSLARVDPSARQAGGAVTQADMAAADNLTPEQRREMIRNMVDGLAEKLKADGSDLDGWLRLLRAYIVLGERDKAHAALADARRALGADPEKRKRLDDIARGLGLES